MQLTHSYYQIYFYIGFQNKVENLMEHFSEYDQLASRNIISTNGVIHLPINQSQKQFEHYCVGDQFLICKDSMQFSFGSCRSKLLWVIDCKNVDYAQWKSTFKFIPQTHGQVKIFQVGAQLYLKVGGDERHIEFTHIAAQGSLFELECRGKKIQSLQDLVYNSQVSIMSVGLKKYLSFHRQDKLIGFSNTKFPIELQLIRKQLKSTEKNYLQFYEQVMLKNQETGMYIGLESTKELFQINENCQINFDGRLDSFSFKIIERPESQVQKNRIAFVWEVNKVKSHPSNYVLHRDQIMFKHVASGINLIKNLQSDKVMFDIQEGQVLSYFGINIRNTRNFCLGNSYDKDQLKPIYLKESVYLEDKKWEVIRVEHPNHVRLFNNDIKKLCEQISEFMKEKNSFNRNLDDLRSLIEGYSWIVDIYQCKAIDNESEYLIKSIKSILVSIQRGLESYQRLESRREEKKTVLRPLINILYCFLIKIINSKNHQFTEANLKKELVRSIGSFMPVQFRGTIETLVFLSIKWESADIIKIILNHKNLISPENQYWYYLCLAEIMENSTQCTYQVNEFISSQSFNTSCQSKIFLIMDSVNRIDILSDADTHNIYLYEMLKLGLRSDFINLKNPKRMVTPILSAMEQTKCPYHLVILLTLLQKLYLDEIFDETCTIEYRKYIFLWNQSLSEETNINQLLNYHYFDGVVTMDIMRSILEKIQFWENNQCCELVLMEFFCLVFSICDGFLSLGEMNLQFFVILEQSLVELCQIIKGMDSSTYPSISNRFKQIGKMEMTLKKTLARLKYEELLSQINDVFDTIYEQKQRLMAYPTNEKQQFLNINKMKDLYLNLLPYAEAQIPILLKLTNLHLNQQSQPILVFTQQDKQLLKDQFKKAQTIIGHLQQIDDFEKLINKKKQAKSQEEISQLITDMKKELDCINQILPHIKSRATILSHKLSDQLFTIIFNAHFDEDLILKIGQFLSAHPPSLNNINTYRKNNSTQTLKKVCAHMISHHCSNSTAPLQIEQILEFVQKQFSGYDLLFLLGFICEVAPYNEEMYIKLYHIHLHLELQSTNVMEMIKIFRTSESIKSYCNSIPQQRKPPVILNFVLILVSLFRLCRSSPAVLKHLSRILTFENMLQIVMDENIPYNLKMAFPLYFQSNRKLQNKAVLEQYFCWIRCTLQSHTNFKDSLNDYVIENPLHTKNMNEKMLLADNVHLSTYNSGIEDEKMQGYWEFLLWRPFFQREEGLLKFLEYLIVNMNEMILIEIEKDIEEIIRKLFQILSIASNEQLRHQINKILFLQKEKLPELRSRDPSEKTNENPDHSCVGHQMISIMIKEKLLKRFINICYYSDYDIEDKPNNRTITQRSTHINSSKIQKKIEETKIKDSWTKKRTRQLISINDMMGSSEENNDNSSHLLLHKSTIFFNLNNNHYYEEKQYMLSEMIDIIQIVCQHTSQSIKLQLQKCILTFYQKEGSTTILKKQIIGKLKALRQAYCKEKEEVEEEVKEEKKRKKKVETQIRQSSHKPSFQTLFQSPIWPSQTPTLPLQKLQAILNKGEIDFLHLLSGNKANRLHITKAILERDHEGDKLNKSIKLLIYSLERLESGEIPTQELIEFIYRVTLREQLELTCLNGIVQLYCVHEKTSESFHHRLYALIQSKILPSLSELGLNYAIKHILSVLLEIPKGHNLIEYPFIRNYIHGKESEILKDKLDSTNLDVSEKIVSLTIIHDYMIKHISNGWILPEELKQLISRVCVKFRQSIYIPTLNDNRKYQLERLYRQCVNIKRISEYKEGTNIEEVNDDEFGEILVKLSDQQTCFVYKKQQAVIYKQFKNIIDECIKKEESYQERKKLIYIISDYILNQQTETTYLQSIHTPSFILSLIIVLISCTLLTISLTQYGSIISSLMIFNLVLVLVLIVLRLMNLWLNCSLILCLQLKKSLSHLMIWKQILGLLIRRDFKVMLIIIYLVFVNIYAIARPEYCVGCLMIVWLQFYSHIEKNMKELHNFISNAFFIMMAMVALILIFNFFTEFSSIAQITFISTNTDLSFFDLLFSQEQPQYQRDPSVIIFNIVWLFGWCYLLGTSVAYYWHQEQEKSCLLCLREEEEICMKSHKIINLVSFIVYVHSMGEKYLSSREKVIKKQIEEKKISIFID